MRKPRDFTRIEDVLARNRADKIFSVLWIIRNDVVAWMYHVAELKEDGDITRGSPQFLAGECAEIQFANRVWCLCAAQIADILPTYRDKAARERVDDFAS